MKEKIKDNTIFLTVFLIIQIILIIILISLIFVFKNDEAIGNIEYARQPAVTIEDLASELPDIQTDYVGAIERQLAKTISLNTKSFDIANSKAIIRQNSLKIQQFENLEGYYYSAIVDIPNLQQSYQIYHHYPVKDNPPNSTPPNVMYVLCLDSFTEKVYPDFHCQDSQPSETRNSIVAYYFKYFDFENYSAWIENSQDNTIKITPVNSNIDNEQKDNYTSKTQEAVSSLGVSPKMFKYYVMESSNYTYYNKPDITNL